MVSRDEVYVGMRVVACVDHPDCNEDITIGMAREICLVTPYYIGVRFDSQISRGHTCRESCDPGYGWELDYDQASPEWSPQDFEIPGDISDHLLMEGIADA